MTIEKDRNGQRNRRSALGRMLKTYLLNPINPSLLLELELMALTLAAGMNDATTYPDYRVFASNQTGNTALLAVGALGIGTGAADLRDVGFSLGMFVLGGYAFGQAGLWFGRKRRGWLLGSNLLQTVLVYGAAAVRKWAGGGTRAGWGVVSLLAFASGGRTYLSFRRTDHFASFSAGGLSMVGCADYAHRPTHSFIFFKAEY